MTQEQALKIAAAPIDWIEGGNVHNWRNYIGENVRRIWDTLTLEQKAAAIMDADDSASKEDWD